MNPETRALLQKMADIHLLLATVELNHFAPRLVEKKLLSYQSMNSILSTVGYAKAHQVKQLMESVVAQVTVTPKKFEDFVKILSADPALQRLAEELTRLLDPSVDKHLAAVLTAQPPASPPPPDAHPPPPDAHPPPPDAHPPLLYAHLPLPDAHHTLPDAHLPLPDFHHEQRPMLAEPISSSPYPNPVLKRYISELEDKFLEVVQAIRVDCNSLNINELKIHLTLLPAVIKPDHKPFLMKHKPEIDHASNVIEIVTLLNLYWDCFNYGLLEHLVGKYGCNQTKQLMEQFVRDVNAFMENTKLADFMGIWKGREEAPSGFSQLVVRHGLDPKQTTLCQVEKFRKDFCHHFSLLQVVLIFRSVHSGSVTVVWLIPSHVAEYLSAEIKNSEIDYDVRMQYSVLEILINGVAVFVCTSGKEEEDEEEKIGKTPLHDAAMSGDAEVVNAPLKARSKVDEKDKVGWSSLMLASQNGHNEVVKMLSAGAKVDCHDKLFQKLKQCLLSSDMCSDSDGVKLLEFTLMNFPQPQPSILRALADAAIKTKKINSLVFLITHNANPLIASVIELIEWDTPNEVLFNFVLMNGTPKEIAEFVTNNIERKYKHGIKNLTDFVPPCFKKLLFNNNAIRRRLLSGILNDHATIPHILMINLLIKFGAQSTDLCQLRFSHSTPLHAATVLALESGICEIIANVMNSSSYIVPFNGKVTNDTGESPYHLVVKSKASDSHKIKVCTALSSLRPLLDPTVKDNKGRQAKEYAYNKELHDLLENVEKTFMCNKLSRSTKQAQDSRSQSDITDSLDKQMKRVLSLNYSIKSVELPIPIVHEDAPCNRSRDHIQYLQTLTFESYPWAIEATPQVFKMLKQISHIIPESYVSIAKGLANMAKGSLHESKLITSGEIQLYKTTIDGYQILWEKAIQYIFFEEQKQYYTQVIRLWDLITSDEVEHFDCTTRRIIDSYSRVKCTPLSVLQSDHKDGYPLVYCTSDKKDFSSSTKFYPAASTVECDYSAVHFYAVTEKFIEAIYTKGNSRFDFPLKLWPDENKIIKKDQESSILLLGRSGTGKTTCCLYQLWSQFQDFWNPEKRCDYDITVDEVYEKTPESEKESSCGITVNDETPLSVLTSEKYCLPEDKGHLRQIFVTKNRLLCDAVKKKFYDLCAPYDYLSQHLNYVEHSTPLKLSDAHPHQYPLFLSSMDFMLLLDRTLPDKKKRFFKTKDGKPFRIVNTDYDLLTNTHINTWVQITCKFFVQHIWPKMLRKYPTKHLDPILVWMEITSFIKGSSEALEKRRPLQQCEYELLGKKMAPNYADVRADIYALFKVYQQICQNWSPQLWNMHDQGHHTHKHQTISLFDECDLVHNLYERLLDQKCLSFAPHRIYVDEVQDFTQAELLLLFVCCLNPNDLFFTGDTAQCVMQGISFRFQDLRSIFTSFKEKLPSIQVPGKDNVLVTNYRSHAGVLNLAASVIDLMDHFFKQSFDSYLPRDKGILEGPCPLLINDHGHIDDVFGHDQLPISEIAFGAQQAVIVRSEAARGTLPKYLQNAIILTVFEAKGLEFNDVLLYNFFSDSMVDQKTWRTILNYSELSVVEAVAEDRDKYSSLSYLLVEFDSKLHKGLNSELKSLYTAVTRAKTKLWIYETDNEKCFPMYHYWLSRHVATKGHVQTQSFATPSSKHAWKVQGDNFKVHKMYTQAVQCYKMSGETHLQKEMEARILMSGAHVSTEVSRFTDAAVLLLEANELCNDPKYINIAAECLEQAMKYKEAAFLYEKLEEWDNAVGAFKQAEDFKNCVRIREKQKKYKEAIEVYTEGKMRIEALDLAKRYVEEEVVTDPDMKTILDRLVHEYASLYAKQKNKSKLDKVLNYMIIPAAEKVAIYWKVCGEYRIALDIYIAEKMLNNALQLMYEQEWYDEGLKLAKEQNVDQWFLNFAIQKARLVLEPDACTHVNTDFIAELQRICDLKSLSKWHPISYLQLSLLRGDNIFSVVQAQQNGIGKLEAYKALFRLRKNEFHDHCKNSIKVVIDACYEARNYARHLSKVHSDNAEYERALHDVMQFYGIVQDRDNYAFPPACYMWTKNRSKIKLSPDLYGMVQLDAKQFNNAIVQHLKSLPVQYLQDTEMEQHLKNMTELCDKNIRSLSVRRDTLKQYLDLHINWLHYCYFMRKPPQKESVEQLLNTSHAYGSFQIKTVRHNKGACKHIRAWLRSELSTLSSSECQTALLFSLWKAGRIVGADIKILKQVDEIVVKLQQTKMMNNVLCSIPVPDSNPIQVHYFSIWMTQASKLIDIETIEEASISIIDKFLAHVIKVEINTETDMVDTRLVMSILEIMTIYATRLLCKIATDSERAVRVPSYYQYAIDVLESEQSHSSPVASGDVCVDTKKLMQLLSKCMKVLIHDGVLEFVLRQSDTPTSCHYLILTLTILGNMEEPQFIQELKDILTKFNIEGCPEFVAHALRVLSNCNWAENIFTLIEYILNLFYPYMRGLSRIIFNELKVEFATYDHSNSKISTTERESSLADIESEKFGRKQDSTSESESDQEENYNEDDDMDDYEDKYKYS